MTAAMVPVWQVSVRKVRAELPGTLVPQLGIGAAFTFLLMMFNVPAPGGTTVHAVGGTLLAALLGPWAACIAVSVALLMQALLFGDGGILAYGANCFNLAFVVPCTGYFIFRFLGGSLRSERAGLFRLGLGAYLSLNLAALCAAIEFGLQPAIARDPAGLPLYCPYPLALTIPGMMLPHLLVAGFVEAFFTVAVFSFLRRVEPASGHPGGATGGRSSWGLLVGLIALCPLGLLAHGTAWGEWGVAGIREALVGGKRLAQVPAGMTQGFGLRAAWQDYALLGLPRWAGYLWSALAGTAILLIIFKLFSLWQRAGAKA